MATFAFSQDGEVRRTSRSFYRGENTNFHPTNASFQGEAAISSYVMQGWIPKERFVTRETAIVAFGSCFASNISNYLHERNYNVLNRGNNDAYVTKLGDGMVNTYAILQQFAWAWEGLTPQADVWHGKKAEDFAYDEAVRLETKELFDNADLFIITLGLSELWYDKPTGEVFWRAVPTDVYDPQRHCFRTASHAETLHNFHRIYELIRRYRPAARILFSVSPIPLTATFRPISCITADAVSKATLRSALDEFLQTHGEADGVYYFPSYEAVKRIFHYQWGEDRRHVRRDVLDFNMKLFEHYYCSQGIGADEVRAAYDHAWELDHNRAENVRQRDAVSYEERRAITKQAKINARIEARRVEREKVLNERREERLRQAQLHRRAKTWVQKAMKTKSATFVQYATQAVIALFALDSLTDWMDWVPLVFE